MSPRANRGHPIEICFALERSPALLSIDETSFGESSVLVPPMAHFKNNDREIGSKLIGRDAAETRASELLEPLHGAGMLLAAIMNALVTRYNAADSNDGNHTGDTSERSASRGKAYPTNFRGAARNRDNAGYSENDRQASEKSGK
jgi:hypothetical protein